MGLVLRERLTLWDWCLWKGLSYGTGARGKAEVVGLGTRKG